MPFCTGRPVSCSCAGHFSCVQLSSSSKLAANFMAEGKPPNASNFDAGRFSSD